MKCLFGKERTPFPSHFYPIFIHFYSFFMRFSWVSFAHLEAEGEVLATMHRHREGARLSLQNLCRAITLVHIQVADEHTRHRLLLRARPLDLRERAQVL